MKPDTQKIWASPISTQMDAAHLKLFYAIIPTLNTLLNKQLENIELEWAEGFFESPIRLNYKY